MTKYSFRVNAQYKRSEIKSAVGLDPTSKGGSWDTGYVQLDGTDFVFCIVGAAGRTGHDYDNYWDGDELVWRGKTGSHKRQPTIERMTRPGAEVHVFWRSNDRAPFSYAGLGKAIEVTDDVPVKVRWRFSQLRQQIKVTPSSKRFPAEAFNAIGADHVFEAVELLSDGHFEHPFGPSTDYDLIAMDGKRLPPKAVFGIAAKLATGDKVLPGHFTGGKTSLCFRILRQAGYQIVPKGQYVHLAPTLSENDNEWTEGQLKLVTHLTRERARGLAQAKRSQFRRIHGRLFCERCKLDPVEVYGSVDGEACIEVHHDDVHVKSMEEGHKTRLEALQCLCANCHRFVHKQLKAL